MKPLTGLQLEHRLADLVGLVPDVASHDHVCRLESNGWVKQTSPRDNGVVRFLPTESGHDIPSLLDAFTQ